MRIVLRPLLATALSLMAWASSIAAFIGDALVIVGSCFRETLTSAFDFVPRLVSHLQPMRRISMAATALNDRVVGGVRIHGSLGRPAVRTLTG